MTVDSHTENVSVSPLMRHTSKVNRRVASARAYFCGLGYHEFYLNDSPHGKIESQWKRGQQEVEPWFTVAANTTITAYPRTFQRLRGPTRRSPASLKPIGVVAGNDCSQRRLASTLAATLRALGSLVRLRSEDLDRHECGRSFVGMNRARS